MAKISETELQKRLKKLEADSTPTKSQVQRVGDQYEYTQDFIYTAYASALANLSSGTITNQSDATDFQFSPYNDAGVLMTYRGFFLNKSVYQSGDPTDYTWEATSGDTGFTSSERYFTTSTGLESTLGNPTKPGNGISWTLIVAGEAVPNTAIYLAERFTLTTTSGAITSNWDITPVGKYVDTTVVAADGIKATNMDLDGTLNVTANSGAVRWGKEDGDDIINSGLFIGRNADGNPRFTIGSTNHFIYFDGTNVSAVGVDEDDTVGTETNFYSTPGTHTFTISALLGTIGIEIAGAGGGGGSGQNANAGTAGSTTYVYVKQSNGSTRDTFSAAGGAAGAAGSGGLTGGNGTAFGNQGNIGNAASDSTSHSGGAGSTHVAEPASRPSGGTGGTASGGGGNGGGGGGGGGAGSYYSTTYTIVSTTDYLSIVIPSGGAGGAPQDGNPSNGLGGAGGAGIVRIKGVLA